MPNQLTTTLEKIRACDPCCEGWKALLSSLNKTRADNATLPLEYIIGSNDFDDALWALQCVDEEYAPAIRLFACYCAKYSLGIFEKAHPDDKRPRLAIEAAGQYAHGIIPIEELTAARDAAWAASDTARAANDAVRDAVRAAAWAAAWAASDTAGAANDAVRAAAWAAAWAASDATGAAVWAARAAARAAVWADFAQEFRRLCRLEGEYGAVVNKNNQESTHA